MALGKASFHSAWHRKMDISLLFDEINHIKVGYDSCKQQIEDERQQLTATRNQIEATLEKIAEAEREIHTEQQNCSALQETRVR